jgi:ferredoxin
MSRESVVIRVDRIRCDGYGMCAELVPELIELDDWGFPLLRTEVVPPHLLDHAQRAVDVCPVVALRLTTVLAATRGAQGAQKK